MGDPKEQPTSDDEAFAAAVWDGADVGRNSAETHLIHDPPCACGGYTEISRGVARFVGRFPICPVCGASLRSSPRSDVFGGGRDLLAEAHERADRLEVERVGLVEQVRELREALMLVENMHDDRHTVFRAVAMHALGRPDALGYLNGYGVPLWSLDTDVRRALEARSGVS